MMEDKIKIVRVDKKKGSLGFSIKGGVEHGIPIVISEIHKNGPPNLHLGDELVYVNEASLSGVTHSEAVLKLRNCKGPSVQLRVRANRILEDTFSSPKRRILSENDSSIERSKLGIPDWWAVPDDDSRPLPRGWSRKVDYKSGKPYFENYLTCTSTWTDPRSLKSIPIDEFDWLRLPPGWERFKDQHGDTYYVNHHTQTTHWDSPRGIREQKQLEELKSIIDREKERLKSMVDDLTEKRTVLLNKNQELEKLQMQRIEEHTREDKDVNERVESDEESKWAELDEGNEDLKAELIEDIMALNDEIDEVDTRVKEQRKKIQKLNEIIVKAHEEEFNDSDQYASAREIAMNLRRLLKSLKGMEIEAHESINELEEIKGPDDTPISYMLQLTPAKKKRMSSEYDDDQTQPSDNEHDTADETTDLIHLLSDNLTGKTNCEMRLELLMLETGVSQASQLTKRVGEVCRWVRETRRGFDWDNVTDQLLGVDLTVFNIDWIQSNDIREKLEIFIS